MSNQQLLTRNAVMEQLEQLEKSGVEQVPVEHVRALVGLLRDFFEGGEAATAQRFDEELYGELGHLARFINDAQKQLGELNPGDLQEDKLPEASNQLDAIVKMTEQATGRIMDACEQMEGLLAGLRERLQHTGMDPDTLAGTETTIDDLSAYVTGIYEACNFQDVTGQRIMKVVEVMREVERQVLRMVVVFGVRKNPKVDDKKVKEGAQLLNGPQLEGKGLRQDDIDDILDALL
jgi:chemotaxis protein CheZ